MTNIIVSGNGRFFKKLVKYLRDDCGLTVCYWISSEELVDDVKADFKECLVVGLQQLNVGNVRDHVDPASLPPLDETILNALSWCEPILFEMMDRMDPTKELRYDDRVRLYKFYLRYWLHIIETLKPDVFFPIYSPHEVSDFVLFALCRHYGIRTVMFEWTSLPKWRLLIEDYRGVPENLKTTYEAAKGQREDPLVSLESERKIALLRGEYTKAMPGYTSSALREANSKGFRASVWARLQRLISLPNKLLSFHRRVPSVLDSLYFPGGIPNGIEFHLFTRYERSLINRRVRKSFLAAQEVYKHLCVEADLTVPYIYLALHYQPERSTCPAGGVFSDQRLVISLLSMLVPKGWVIYVKEHPGQFLTDNGRYAYLARNCAFYMDIAAHQNVRLIRQDVPQFELIDNSRAVATITGTSGWEALVRGKPALIFGDVWYQACDGAYRIHSSDDCKRALANISRSGGVLSSDIRKFVAAVEKIGVNVYLGEEESMWDGDKYDEQSNVTTAGGAISNFLQEKKDI